VPGLRDLALTTNGVRLPQLALPLRRAGLRRLNVHLDSLDPERVARVMRWGTLAEIWAGIEAADAAGFSPLKLNAVIVRGFNEDDVGPARGSSRSTVRGTSASSRRCRSAPATRRASRATASCRRPSAADDRSDARRAAAARAARPVRRVAQLSRAERRGVIGFISPVTEPYCGTCNRMRLTADGRFHLCLLNDDELDVRGTIRAAATSRRSPTSCCAPSRTSRRATLWPSAERPPTDRCSKLGDDTVGVTIEGLADAASVLGQAVLGPAELEKALGYDPLKVLTPDERRAVERVPFSRADLERAKTDGEILVLRVPRDPDGPLTMLALSKRLSGGLDPKVHTGVGYMLRDEWTIDAQPFATDDTCAAGWWLVRRRRSPRR
jgi:hypothetical protein